MCPCKLLIFIHHCFVYEGVVQRDHLKQTISPTNTVCRHTKYGISY